MKANNIDNFTSRLKDFAFNTFEDFFPDITREEFDKLFDGIIKLKGETK